MSPFATAPRGDAWLTRSVRIEDVTREVHDIDTYILRFLDQTGAVDYQFIPGQFNMLYLPGVGESAISMSGNPSRADCWVHTVRVAGNVTRTLSRLKPGDTLGIRGPFGSGWPVDELRGNDVVIVAGGLGMAPLRPLVYHLINQRDQFGKVWLILGARSPDGLLYGNEWVQWQRRGIEIQPTVDFASSSWNGHVGVVTLLVDRLRLERPDRTHLVACGPEVMMRYSAISGAQQGITLDHIWVSLERNMQCAVGLCGHCQLGPAFICKDGPVIRYDRVQQFLSIEQL